MLGMVRVRVPQRQHLLVVVEVERQQHMMQRLK
jgi:hypothetical protein